MHVERVLGARADRRSPSRAMLSARIWDGQDAHDRLAE